MARVTLVTVVVGEAYERYAEQLFVSAHEHFQVPLETVMLAGRPGWPNATLYRYHAIREHAEELNGDYVFLCDADMRFEAPVREEILSELVATQHPGYVGRRDLPYEDRPESVACVTRGTTYYAGGFVGGEREDFLNLSSWMESLIDEDAGHGLVARWHDESYLNRLLASSPPSLTLTPAYCHPDDNSAYLSIWPEIYERKLVALDKDATVRANRGTA